MYFQGYIIADSEIIGIGPIRKKYAGTFSNYNVLHFEIFTKQTTIQIESEQVHAVEALNEDNAPLHTFNKEYKVLRSYITSLLRPKPIDALAPTLERNVRTEA
jgi:hypothetical protein